MKIATTTKTEIGKVNAPRIEPYIAPEDICYASTGYLRQLLKEDLDVELHDMIFYELFERRGLL